MKWQEPPEDRRGENFRSGAPGRKREAELDALADELKANPGRWALVEEDVNPGNGQKYKRRGLQLRYRATGNGVRQDIYARYTPGE